MVGGGQGSGLKVDVLEFFNSDNSMNGLSVEEVRLLERGPSPLSLYPRFSRACPLGLSLSSAPLPC